MRRGRAERGQGHRGGGRRARHLHAVPLAGALHGRPPPWSERLLAARDGWQGTLRPRESRAHLCRRREGRATRGRRVAYPSPARCCHRTRELTCSGGAGGGGTGRRRHRTIGHLAAQERLGSARVPLRGDDELADVAARPIDAQYDDRRADGRRQHALHIAEVLGTAKGEQRVAHLEAGFARRRARRGRVRDDAKGAHAGRRRSEHLGRRLVRRHAGLLRRRASTESDREERGEETTGAGGYRRLPTCLCGTVRAPYSLVAQMSLTCQSRLELSGNPASPPLHFASRFRLSLAARRTPGRARGRGSAPGGETIAWSVQCLRCGPFPTTGLPAARAPWACPPTRTIAH